MQRNIYNSVRSHSLARAPPRSEFLSLSTHLLHVWVFGRFLFGFFLFPFPAFNWRQFMGNNFMACSEASNFDAIIIAPIHFILHSIRFIHEYSILVSVCDCVCLSLKSISLPFSRHITLPIALSLPLSFPRHFYIFSIQCA